jgi:3',5'-nucleoside bisphosphate phosphatase
MPRRDPFTAVCQQMASVSSRVVADLHCHTVASDGELTLSQLLIHAKNARLEALAITDHDCLPSGQSEVEQFGKQQGFRLINGVELSCSYFDQELHLLGLDVDVLNKQLIEACDKIMNSRRERFHAFIFELGRIGLAIPQHLISHTVALSQSLGRRHVANLILDAGFRRSRHAIFSELLPQISDKVPSKKLLPIHDAIDLVHQAGGIAVLAHPPSHYDEKIYQTLKQLDGIEIRYSGVSQTQTDYLREIARSLEWVVSAGSDFHAPPHHQLGSNGVTSAEYKQIIERMERNKHSYQITMA